MESLKEIIENHKERLVNKWDNYIEVYETFLEKFRGKEFTFLEIGVAHGGSLQIWRKYFGEKATLIGVDVNPECKKFEDKETKIFIGSQSDPAFLESLKKQIPKVDILLDDGGHTMNQQITTFKHLFDHVKENGLYVCEDLHTSYWSEFGGGYKNKKSFIEFSKNFIDNLHGWHAKKFDKNKMHNYITNSVFGIHYYNSIVVIEKRKINPPQNLFIGKEQLEHHYTDYGVKKSKLKKVEAWVKSLLR